MINVFLTLIALCGVRLIVLLMIFPPTGGNVLNTQIRNSLVILWGTYIAWGQQALMPQMHGAFRVVEAVGTYIDDLTGYNNVQISNPSLGQQTTLTSTLLIQCAIVAFWTLGGITFLLGAVFETYRWWPLASVTPVPAAFIQTFVMTQTDSLMAAVAKLAAPAVLLLLLVDIGIGLLSRVAQ